MGGLLLSTIVHERTETSEGEREMDSRATASLLFRGYTVVESRLVLLTYILCVLCVLCVCGACVYMWR